MHFSYWDCCVNLCLWAFPFIFPLHLKIFPLTFLFFPALPQQLSQLASTLCSSLPFLLFHTLCSDISDLWFLCPKPLSLTCMCPECTGTLFTLFSCGPGLRSTLNIQIKVDFPLRCSWEGLNHEDRIVIEVSCMIPSPAVKQQVRKTTEKHKNLFFFLNKPEVSLNAQSTGEWEKKKVSKPPREEAESRNSACISWMFYFPPLNTEISLGQS